MSELVVNGITSWGDDFCTRMMEGEEKTAWDSTPWDNSPLLVEIELTRNRAWYTFGYTFGYLGEQCVTAAISAGTVTLGKIIAKNGTVLISKLAPRAMGVLAIRLHFIKEALASMNLADDGLRYVYEGMMSSAARQPTTPVIEEIPASLHGKPHGCSRLRPRHLQLQGMGQNRRAGRQCPQADQDSVRQGWFFQTHPVDWLGAFTGMVKW